MTFKKVLFYTAIIFLVGCSSKKEPRPNYIIPEETFVSIMVNVQLTEAMKNQQALAQRNNPVDIISAYTVFLERQGVSTEEFFQTYSYYRKHPAEFQAVYEKVLDSLNKMNVQLRTDLELAHDSLIRKIDSAKKTNTTPASGGL